MTHPVDRLCVTVEVAIDAIDDPGGDVDPERWRLLAEHALRTEGVCAGELHLVFVDEATMAELNETHMGGTGPTDVLAFPLDEPATAGLGVPVLLGDVVVCAPVAARNAPGRVDDEIALLVVHGILHVLGHDHVDDDETASCEHENSRCWQRTTGHARDEVPVSGGEIVALVAVVVMIALAALLAAAETAITRVSTARAEALVEEGRRGAKVLRTLIDQRERVLNPLLLVVLGCQLGAATIVAVVVDRRWGTDALVAVFAVELLFVYVVAEAIPKSWSLAYPDRSATAIAPVARLVSSIAPLRWIANGVVRLFGAGAGTEDPHGDVAEEELLALAEEAAASEAIDEDERKLIEHIITFGDTVVKEVMVPRPDMVALESDCIVRSAIEIVILNGFSRVPVFSTSIDDIVGIVHSKDLLRAGQDDRTDELVTTLMREPRFVPESKRIAELLREMQGEKFHMAIVIDEYGGTAGLVTLEDLIEEVVGEIVDEFDVEQPMIEQVDGVSLRVNGRVPLDDLGELLGRELPDGDWSTVGGLIFNSLGHVPAVGEVCEVDGHRFLVERVQGRRIARVLMTPAPARRSDEVEVS